MRACPNAPHNSPKVLLGRSAPHRVVHIDADATSGPRDQWLHVTAGTRKCRAAINDDGIPTPCVQMSRDEVAGACYECFQLILADTLDERRDATHQHAAVLDPVQQEFTDAARTDAADERRVHGGGRAHGCQRHRPRDRQHPDQGPQAPFSPGYGLSLCGSSGFPSIFVCIAVAPHMFGCITCFRLMFSIMLVQLFHHVLFRLCLRWVTPVFCTPCVSPHISQIDFPLGAPAYLCGACNAITRLGPERCWTYPMVFCPVLPIPSMVYGMVFVSPVVARAWDLPWFLFHAQNQRP